MSLALCALAFGFEQPKAKPVMRDFIGLNVHTVQFKADLYKPVAKRLRDYHGFDWDVADDTSYTPQYPMARNGVNWKDLYGTWKEKGYTTSVSLMFDQILPPKWKNFPHDGFNFGKAFGQYFGRETNLMVEAIEIGNEPGKYNDADYRMLFESVAKGVRSADPRIKISTCAMFDRPSGDYHKSLECVKGLNSLYDVINLHSYAEAEPWPTWRRSYPEDAKIPFLKDIQAVIDWRNKNAPGKEVWLTEFGWDSTTQPQAKTGDFSKWVGNTGTEQAQWIVRAYLNFAAMDLDRAYLFWFNDEDVAQLHGSSGLTRKYVPKPSFHALAHLQKTLGSARFVRSVVKRSEDLYVYEFRSSGETIWAAWSPTGTGRKVRVDLPKAPGKIMSVDVMPLGPEPAKTTPNEILKDGSVRIEVSESPVFLRFGR